MQGRGRFCYNHHFTVNTFLPFVIVLTPITINNTSCVATVLIHPHCLTVEVKVTSALIFILIEYSISSMLGSWSVTPYSSLLYFSCNTEIIFTILLLTHNDYFSS
jgi:hypothetical protein